MDLEASVVLHVRQVATGVHGRDPHPVAPGDQLPAEHPDVLLHAARRGRIEVGQEQDAHQSAATRR